MAVRVILSLCLLLIGAFILAGDPPPKADPAVRLPALRDELKEMVRVDQDIRTRLMAGGTKIDVKLAEEMAAIDAKNTARMKAIIAEHGWPGKSLVGEAGAQNAWLLIQHADHDRAFQKQCLELLREAVAKKEASGKNLAYLIDRVLVGEGKKQFYGTQYITKDGKTQPQPIEDPDYVDKRRAEVGLGTLAEYEKRLREAYKEEPAKKRTRGPVTVSPEAMAIHRDAILVDGHNDLPWELRTRGDSSFRNFDIARSQPLLHTDIPRLKAGGVGAQFWSVFVPSSTTKDSSAVRKTLEQIDIVQRMVRQYPNGLMLATSVDDILRARKDGKIASLIGIEGGHSIDNSLGVLRAMHALGVRYMTLTHAESLDWADSATDKPKANGLTPFGEQVVAEMNRLGMFVDISHVSVETMKHALRVTKAPVIASHSSAFALAEHPRNVPDEVLKLMPANGGVIMVNFYSGFIVPEGARARAKMFEIMRELRQKYPNDKDLQEALKQYQKENPIPRGSVHDVVDHIDHIVKVAGIDHVGLGSDFDGIPSTPEQLEDVSKYPVITQVLLDRGYTKEQIHKILGGNLLRAMRQMEEISKRMTNAQ
jgi:membrane dipeptidase